MKKLASTRFIAVFSHSNALASLIQTYSEKLSALGISRLRRRSVIAVATGAAAARRTGT